MTALDQIARVRGPGRRAGSVRRSANQETIQAYALLLASHFQGFCRDLHTECIEHILRMIALSADLEPVARAEFTRGRQLDRGNAQPSSLGADFDRLGIIFWRTLEGHDTTAAAWKSDLELLNEWRNAIAHQDFTSPRLGGTMTLRLIQVRQWRHSCGRLAGLMDEVLGRHLRNLTGVSPW